MTTLTKTQIDDYEQRMSDRMADVDFDDNPAAAGTWLDVENTHRREQDLYNEFLRRLQEIHADRVCYLDRLSDILDRSES